MSTLQTTILKHPDSASNNIQFDASGRVGIGTSSPVADLHVKDSSSSGQILVEDVNGGRGYFIAQINGELDIYRGNEGSGGDKSIRLRANDSAGTIQFQTGGSTERMRINSSGKVLVATTLPSNYADRQLTVGDTSLSSSNIEIRCASNGFGGLTFSDSTASDVNSYRGTIEYGHSTNHMQFRTNAVERMRIDSSGKVGIGMSTTNPSVTNAWTNLQVNGANVASPVASRTSGTPPSNLHVSTNQYGANQGGSISFGSQPDNVNSYAAYGSVAGRRNSDLGYVYAGYLQFNTSNGGTLIERMRIDSSGNTSIGKTGYISRGTNGHYFADVGWAHHSVDNDSPLWLNRNSTDGKLIDFSRAGATAGYINVSGGTVTLVGAHLSRWSQLPGGKERVEILRGSILSNLDEMCEWGDEDNEQLNRMKLSDVEGDKNVSGVFDTWDNDDKTYTNDLFCAMTGDFVIRIAEGTTVERGDLLMSAGDGTAKPQDDDIIRSKTIAKVTSTSVSETYADGSYCVPCVLMAC